MHEKHKHCTNTHSILTQNLQFRHACWKIPALTCIGECCVFHDGTDVKSAGKTECLTI